ncbi:hypothetical protein [Candidatus Parabeggiatoa sp. HSG14]|uniref:hypothetical protein n=1 Tax=Candidatus Parabeggiatoa sp. HSG14 TaxID=3055593 RepID=UPI0025A862DE|nr:hypothetical protein [Thiotrichales bacterium HSG14]
MSQYILDLPDNLLEQAEKIATQKQISTNQLFVNTIAEKLSTLWESQNLLKERAKRVDINACRAVLAKVPDNPVDELDRIL